MKATKISEVTKLNTDMSVGNLMGTQGSSALASGAGDRLQLTTKKGVKKGKKKSTAAKSG